MIQFTAESTGTGPEHHAVRPGKPNEVGTTNTTRRQDRNFRALVKSRRCKSGIKVFVGPRRDPFFFDLAQFFKIIPDRNYMNHPNPPPATATSFRFASASSRSCSTG